jgi:hypothetical protein
MVGHAARWQGMGAVLKVLQAQKSKNPEYLLISWRERKIVGAH